MFIFLIFAPMEKVYIYYKDNIDTYNRLSDNLRKKIHLFGTIRLLIAVTLLITLWFFWAKSWEILLAIFVVYMIPFAILLLYHNKLSAKKTYAEAMIKLCENELKGLDYDYSAFDGAPEESSSDHSFSLDLDIFGDRSILQSINRTVTTLGKEKLVHFFLNPLQKKEDILQRQEAIRELAAHSHLRHHFYVTGSLQPGNKKDKQFLDALTNEKNFFINSPLWKILTWVIPVAWIITIVAVALNIIAGSWLGIWFGVSFLIAYIKTSQVTKLYNTVDKMEKIFSTYSQLMKSIEGDTFQSVELTQIATQLVGRGGKTASQVIKQLSGYIAGLNQRFSAAGMILNILYLRDIRHAISLERWKKTYRKDVVRWLEALGHFDALSSLGGFAFNHADYIYPEIAETYFQMEGKALGHPLLNRDKCVRNDINIQKSPSFLIITGANMAGKSTYLRTVGVNYLLACMGAPVCAESLTLYPASLVTSLRTSDSLVSNESYFFAELKRLKMIIDRLKSGEEMFIILDEILKGTNSVDKQKGSIALMKQLVAYKTCGIIATHDLVLGTLEEEFPNEIKNYRFEADITDDELTFSYLLREGIAQNMNAYFLMKKMGITV